MRIRLLRSFTGYNIGTELDIDNAIGRFLTEQCIAKNLDTDSHNSALVDGYKKNDKKSVDEAPSDKMVRRGDTRRKSKVK